MKIKIAAACFLAGALVLPVTGHAADDDTDRSSPKAFFVSDAIITAKIKAKLAEEKLASAVQIKVDTDDKGVVILSGTAKTQEEADKAVSIARNVEGVGTVENNIKVAARK
jgi:hyperosmotically inducible protein